MQKAKPKSILAYLVEVLSVVGLLLHALVILGSWSLLPESIPVHFNLAGRADAWGDKYDLLLLFGLNLLTYVSLTWLARYPHKFNYAWQITEGNAKRQYSLASNFIKVLKCQTIWLFAIISLQIIGISFGLASGLGYLFVPLVIAVTSATIIGYFIVASRSAFEDTQ